MTVPNKFPTINNSRYRVAFIGEAPRQDEVTSGEPFVGISGRVLKDRIAKALIDPNACFFGNVCQTRPPANEISAFDWNGEEIQSGLAQLRKDLAEYKPWLVVLLGKTAMYAANSQSNITDMRGSLFVCNDPNSPLLGFKCLPTYHPDTVFHMYEWLPILDFDLCRAAEEGQTTFLNIPKRDITVCKTLSDVSSGLDKAKVHLCGTDIEGYVHDMQCIGIATSPNEGFVIPFRGPDGLSFWSEADELEVWKMLAAYLQDPTALKVWQNGLYDRFVIQYSYNIVCLGNIDDTMLEWHEMYCELPKGLAMQASLLTKEPFYKFERKTTSWETKMRYCGKDACVTLECHQQMAKRLPTFYGESSRTHYLFNRDLLNPLLYMELRGIRYDSETAKARREGLQHEIYTLQYELDSLTGYGLGNSDALAISNTIQDLMCYKRDRGSVKKGYENDYPRAIELAGKETLTATERGELSSLAKVHCNVDSPKFTQYLYNKLRLPVQINKQTKQPTANYEALLRLTKKTEGDPKKVCETAIQIRDKSTRAGMLEISSDNDGRIRCGYNCVGTNTGRLTSYTSPTGSGYNLQTIPKKDRDLFVADPGYHFFQCDLSGADGWTIGAHSANLGDPTLLEDIRFGLKPARILCLMLRHGTGINSKSREELKVLSLEVSSDDWDYFAFKCGFYGSCYLMGVRKLGDLIFYESSGKVLLAEREVSDIQRLCFIRYHGIKQWHESVKRKLSKHKSLTAASGLTRRFFGRETEILGEALAFEPQANTTYATNLAALNLWNDHDNRVSNRLRIEPLHQVHDAICGQFKKEDTTWATAKIKSYFDNTLTIANQPIVIPFEGSYGISWGNLKEGNI